MLMINVTENDWQVSDVNDHRPQFEREEYSADLVENNYIGAIILTVRSWQYLLTLIRVQMIHKQDNVFEKKNIFM